MDYFGIILGITLVLMYLVFRVSASEIEEQRRIEWTLMSNRIDRAKVMHDLIAIVHQRGFFDPGFPQMQKLRKQFLDLCDD